MRDYRALVQFLAERAEQPFDWELNDCVRFSFGAVEAQTGVSHLEGLRWRTEKGAARLLKRGGGMEAMVTQRLRPIPLAMAGRGDIAGVVHEKTGMGLMVVEGATLIGPGPVGSVWLPRNAMIAAWSAD
jgi:hypothetical protein